MFAGDFIVIFSEMIRGFFDPVAVLQALTRRWGQFDSDGTADRAAQVRDLVQDNLAGAGGDGEGLDNVGLIEVLADGVAAAVGQVQSVVSRYGCR